MLKLLEGGSSLAIARPLLTSASHTSQLHMYTKSMQVHDDQYTSQVYSGFEVTCPDCDLQSALDHAARDPVQTANRNRDK